MDNSFEPEMTGPALQDAIRRLEKDLDVERERCGELEDRLSELESSLDEERRANASLSSQRRLLEAAVEDLLGFLDQINRHCRDVFASRRWRIGSWIVDAALRLRRRVRPPTAEDHLGELFRKVGFWKGQFRTLRATPNRSELRRRQRTTSQPVDSSFSRMVATISDPPPAFSSLIDASEQTIAELATDMPPSAATTLVSIIMPTYNRAGIVDEAIRSVLEQTYENWELLVCDDGSTDDTFERVQALGDDRIVLVTGQHSGAAAARNRGLARARGELIAYLDSDNIWHPRHLELFVAQLGVHTGQHCAFAKYVDAVIGGDRTVLKKASRLPFSYTSLQEKNFIDLNCLVHHRALYDRLGGFDEALARQQDWDLALKYCYLREPLYLDTFVCFYRRNGEWDQITDREHNNESTAATISSKVQGYYKDGLPTAIQNPRPSLTIVSWDICRNHFSKAYNLAEAISTERDVQLIGFRFFEDPVFPPYADATSDFETLYLDGAELPDLFEGLAQAVASVRGDVIYAVKPRLPSLGMALLASSHFGCPVIVEANDHETAAASPGEYASGGQVTRLPNAHLDLHRLDLGAPELASPYSTLWSRVMEVFAHEVPFVVTHNQNLDRHFGERSFQQRNLKDEAYFDPDLYDRAAARTRLGFGAEDRVLLFGGMLRRHKGIFELAEFLERLGDENTRLVFVGSRETPDQKQLVRRHGRRVVVLPPQDRNAMAEINLAADAVVIWLDPAIPASHYQMPYKLTDALAMGTPVIANPISDLARLGEQGMLRLVDFADMDGLAAALDELTADPQVTRAMTARGRRLYLREFSYASARRNMDLLIDRAMAQRGPLEAATRFAELFAKLYEQWRDGAPS